MPDYKQGSYNPKKVISLAPDALVYINGKESVTTCVKCGRDSSVVDDITDLSVSVSLEATNSASFTIIAPRYDKTRWDVRGNPRIKPMFEVEIYMRGRFLVNDEPRYYPVFWGIVTSVDAGYSDGQNTLKVDCEGILRWWELSKINVQPAIVDQTVHSDKANPSPWTNVFGEMNPYDIIWNLATITTGGLLAPQAFDGSYRNEAAIDSSLLDSQDTAIMKYWQDRFVQVGKALRIFGFKGERQDPALAVEAAKSGQDKRTIAVSSLAAERRVNPGAVPNDRVTLPGSAIGTSAEDIEAFRPFGQVSKGFDLFASEMTSKLELATQVKNTLNYEFYQDTTGEIIFKPPFYNIDVRPFPPYRIEAIDIINMNITEAESEIITRVDVKGSIHHLLIDAGDPSLQPYGFYVDPDLATKFGLRQATVNMNYLDTSADCFAYAVGELDRLNKRRFSGSMTIMGRPELRVGFPIYVPHRDTFYYVTSVSHSLSFGGTFTTTLGLEAARRKRYEEEKGKPTDVALTNRIHRGITKVDTYGTVGEKVRKETKLKENVESTKFKVDPVDQAAQKPPGTTDIENLSLGLQVVGTIASSFEIVEDASITRVTLEKQGTVLKAPLTDREGYEVVGGYEYGRNIVVSPRGDLQVLAENLEIFHVSKVGNLSTSVEGDSTGEQDIRYGSTAQVGSTQLSMEPRRSSQETQIKELAASADPTMETQNKAVTKSKVGEGESALRLEPGLKKRDAESKCACHRLDRKIDPILRRESLKSAETPQRGSTQPSEEEFEELAYSEFPEFEV